MDLYQTRIANARRVFKERGGLAPVAKLMGYSGSSALSQIFGPNPTRTPGEKIARKLESVLGLPTGSLDEFVPGVTDGYEAMPLRGAPNPGARHKYPNITQPKAVGAGTGSACANNGYTGVLNPEQLRQSIELVNRLIVEQKLSVASDRFSSLVAMAYNDAQEHDGVPRESLLRNVVQLIQ